MNPTTPENGPASAADQRTLIVLVHGFGSSPECWDKLVPLLEADAAFRESSVIARFAYSTHWFQFSILRRIPRLSEIAAQLKAFLDLDEYDGYKRVILVGHSQGGLVIQSFLAEELNAGRGHGLAKIIQVVMISTPNLGSTVFSGLRKLLFWANSQEHCLRVLNEEISGVVRTVTERIESSNVNDGAHRQIPIKCFWGDQDRVVPEASAKAQFENVTALAGDHFTVITPAGPSDRNFRLIMASLVSPSGHKFIHEIESYTTEIKVTPLDGIKEFDFHLVNRTRQVSTDNIATLRRAIKFASSNRCKSTYALRYATRNDGYVRMRTSHANLADPVEASRYEDNGIEATFRFSPKYLETFVLELEVYRGFDQGHRDFHMHLPGQAHYREINVALDLSDYLSSGWQLTEPPQMFFHREDQGHSDLCRNRTKSGEPRMAVDLGSGRWAWKLRNIRHGVIDIRWDVGPKG